MKLALKLAIILSFIALVGICNDTATLSEILLTILVSGTIITVSFIALSFSYREQFSLDFYNEQGHHKHIRAYNIIGKWMAIIHYRRQGYEVVYETIYEED